MFDHNNQSLISISFIGLVLLTLMQEFWWMNMNGTDHVLTCKFMTILIFLEALTIPAWMWISLEIKGQTSYEEFPSDSEEQPINNQSRA